MKNVVRIETKNINKCIELLQQLNVIIDELNKLDISIEIIQSSSKD